jgi:hypothetical protein
MLLLLLLLLLLGHHHRNRTACDRGRASVSTRSTDAACLVGDNHN